MTVQYQRTIKTISKTYQQNKTTNINNDNIITIINLANS